MAKMITRYWLCNRCKQICTCSGLFSENAIPGKEDKCPDPLAPGGYWYCKYIELVPVNTLIAEKPEE